MEFKIYNPQEEGFLKEIDWNYEELKTEIFHVHEVLKYQFLFRIIGHDINPNKVIDRGSGPIATSHTSD